MSNPCPNCGWNMSWTESARHRLCNRCEDEQSPMSLMRLQDWVEQIEYYRKTERDLRDQGHEGLANSYQQGAETLESYLCTLGK